MALVHRAEYLCCDDMRAMWRTAWPRQARYVFESSTFFRDLYAGRAVTTEFEAIAGLPFCDKEMLRESQRRVPPFGEYLAAPPGRVTRLHRTSGTTGQAMNLAMSRKDAEVTAAVGGRCQAAAGLGPGHRVVHCLNYQLWMGGVTDHLTLEHTGALVVPFGVGSTELLVETIRELDIDAISCTPSYPAVIERVISDRFPGLRPRDLGLRLGLFGGEPGLESPALRARLRETWGLEPRNANYGVSDVFCNFAGQCVDCDDLHFMAADVLFPELLTPETETTVPLREGEDGELVLTHLERECQPLIRFRTGDMVSITGTGPCTCGRTGFRFRVIGRSDDMIVVRGINVYPTMIAAVINEFETLSGEYRVRLTGPGPYDHLPVEAECAGGTPSLEGLRLSLQEAIHRHLRVRAEVRLCGYETLPRTAGKTKRVIREAG